jgi:hypothetical protein
MSPRTTVFVSYCHSDVGWLRRLQVHLKPLARQDDFALWDDTRIDPGDLWRQAIRTAIGQAAASVLLISADFLASDFVTSEELPPLLAKAETEGARILPIIVQPCRLAAHPKLAQFQSLNPPDRPLSKLSMPEAEDVFVKAAEQVEALLRTAALRRQPAGVAGTDATGARTTTEGLFADLQSSVMALSVLVTLAKVEHEPHDQTLTDIELRLGAVSRKLAFDAVERLSAAGWITKRRVSGRTKYQIAEEGIRQLHRLASATDGPLRVSCQGLSAGPTPVSRPEADGDPAGRHQQRRPAI